MLTIETQTVDRQAIIPVFWRRTSQTSCGNVTIPTEKECGR
jgi:hypothetical protein